MHKLTIATAALLLASTAVHAGNSISFEIEGQKIRIDAPRNCVQLSCITITAPGLSKTPIKLKDLDLNGFGGSKDDEEVAASSATPAQPAPTVQAPATQLPVQATAPQVQAPAVNNAPAGQTVANAAPAPTTTSAPPLPAPAATSIAPTQPSPATVATAPQAAPAAAAPSAAPTTPIGLWATEENKGNVRIEPCGDKLCGFAENTGERILINMKPSESKWVGRIHDPDSGRNFDSTIAMKGPNLLRVQGCAFGGMFCGGQTWKRVS